MSRSRLLQWMVVAVISACMGALMPLGSVAQQTAADKPAADAAAPAADGGTAGADSEASPADGDEEAEAPPEDAYTDEELDDLVAPVALYPDALLAQVLVAATYPLDVVKAQRWADKNTELAEDKRTDAAGKEGWDPSVAVLAAGFPTVLKKMADEIDWTEQLGEAMVVQDGDVLDAVQRQRARAAAAGNLEDNEAQKIATDDDEISITPADPNVVYVPVYDTQTVYTQPATTTTVVKEDDTKYTGGEMVLTGVMAFGAGMLVNELFDDDDDWGGYWRGPPPVRWGGGGGVYARPGRNVNINGDVNINSNNNNKWQPDRRQKAKAKNDIKKRNDKAGNRKGSARKVADRGAGVGKRDVKRPAQKSKSASLESRMKKRDTGAKKKGPAAKKRDNNAFKGARGNGTASKKSLDRGRASSKKKAAVNSNKRKSSASPKRKANTAPKRKTGAAKHKRPKGKSGTSKQKNRGKAAARSGGGRR